MSISSLNSVYFGSDSPRIIEILELLEKDEEGRALIQVLNDKKITIRPSEDDFTRWSWIKNVIELGPKALKSPADTLAYLIFELNNAIQTFDFQKVILNSKTVDELVEGIERCEYISAIKTNRLVINILGGDQEFFYRHVPESFKHHYALQQILGHSQDIAAKYRPDEPYMGTHEINKLDQKGKELLYALFYSHLRREDETEYNKYLKIRGAISNLKDKPNYQQLHTCCVSLFG